MTAKTILMPFTRASGGGSFVSAALLAYGLQKIGHRVISVFPEEGAATTLFRRYGCEVRIVQLPIIESPINPFDLFRKNLSLALEARKVVRSSQIDIIHCNDNSSILPWGIAARMQNKPSVWHVRSAHKCKTDFLRFQVTTLPICISKFVISRLPKNEKRLVIHNPVDHVRFSPCANKRAKRELLGVDEDAVALIQVGRDCIYKRPEWSVLTLNTLLQNGINAFLIFLGDFCPSRQQELRKLLNTDSPSALERIKFFDWVADPELYIGGSDILLHPAYEEHFGRIFVEAAACGVPVIATRSGGAPEVIVDNVTGCLASPTDLADFSAKTLSLLADRAGIIQMGLNAISRSKIFSIESHAQQVSNAYEKYLNLDTFRKF